MTFPLPPGSTIGILGGGQLGRMLSLAAARLGFDTAVLSPEPESPAARVCAHAIVASYDDPAALEALASVADIVTFEFENVPATILERIAERRVPIAPDGRALAIAQDRLAEKTFLNGAGLATVRFAAVDSLNDLVLAVAELGTPLILKTRRGGYDGKGQAWVRTQADVRAAWAAIGERPAIAEAAAGFVRECAVIGARGRDSAVALYPLTQSVHENGILRRTLAPAETPPQTHAQAKDIAARLLVALDYVGVLGVELFELADGTLLVNEFAPRVHNTGHWTLDGCEVDQFEQHIRAIAGWPLGPTDALTQVEMINLIGDDVADWRGLVGEGEARLWLYGKGEARPGRKMGHVNRLRWRD
jgi:5-(carboxyamino)imidazole ribonucleotide synthase